MPALWVYAQLIRAVDLFMSISFVKCNQFHILPSLFGFQLFDGTTAAKKGVVSITRSLFERKITRELRFTCMQLCDEVAVILGNAWRRNEHAIIDFGAVEPVYTPTTVCLSRTQCTLTPTTEYTSPPGACCMIAVRKAMQLLVAPRSGCKPAFLVAVKEYNADSISSTQQPNDPKDHEHVDKLNQMLRFL
jgi:hypothetical protein